MTYQLSSLVVEWLTVLLSIRKSRVHISARKPAILTEVFRGFLCPPGYFQNSGLKLDHDCFLPRPLQITIHLSPFKPCFIYSESLEIKPLNKLKKVWKSNIPNTGLCSCRVCSCRNKEEKQRISVIVRCVFVNKLLLRIVPHNVESRGIYIYIVTNKRRFCFTMELYYTQKLNTPLLNTIKNSSRILTLVWQILELQQLRVMSSGF
jgi:hypothetical protein